MRLGLRAPAKTLAIVTPWRADTAENTPGASPAGAAVYLLLCTALSTAGCVDAASGPGAETMFESSEDDEVTGTPEATDTQADSETGGANGDGAGDAADGDSSSTTADSAEAGTSDSEASTGDAGSGDSEDADSTESDTGESGDETGTGEDAGEGPDDDDDTSSESSDTDDPELPDDLPKVTGTCPEFAQGDLEFSPAELGSTRKARVWLSEAAQDQDGPLVFYWHGTGSSPAEAAVGLGAAAIADITDRGGIVVAPYADPDAGTFPWFLVASARNDDLILADEILACALRDIGIDSARIHTLGMSAGGLQSSQMSFRRSNYMASAVIYSGGIIQGTPPDPQPDHLFPAMIFHGGPSDVVVVSFSETSERYLSLLQDGGRFGFICDHGRGHEIPTDARPSVLQFLNDHPYATVPDPYEDGLPAGFPDYCSLPALR